MPQLNITIVKRIVTRTKAFLIVKIIVMINYMKRMKTYYYKNL